ACGVSAALAPRLAPGGRWESERLWRAHRWDVGAEAVQQCAQRRELIIAEDCIHLPLAFERQGHDPLVQLLARVRELDDALARVGGVDRHLQVTAAHQRRDGAAHRALVDTDDLRSPSRGQRTLIADDVEEPRLAESDAERASKQA